MNWMLSFIIKNKQQLCRNAILTLSRVTNENQEQVLRNKYSGLYTVYTVKYNHYHCSKITFNPFYWQTNNEKLWKPITNNKCFCFCLNPTTHGNITESKHRGQFSPMIISKRQSTKHAGSSLSFSIRDWTDRSNLNIMLIFWVAEKTYR